MKRPRFLLLLAALTVLGAGVACGGGDDNGGGNAAPEKTAASGAAGAVSESGGGSTVEVTAKEFGFEPKELSLPAGKATKIVLKNGGAVEHDITLDDPAFKLAVAPTKTAEAQLTIPAAGSYTFYCSVPGHRQNGMEGTVTVS